MIWDIGGQKVSPLGLGTYGIGGRDYSDSSNDKVHIDAIRFAIENGITFIDTAEVYSGGHSEELVGKAIKTFGRENIFITTKVWSKHLRHDDLIKAAKGSLKRLGTEYIDLYLIHWPSTTVPFKESIGAMEELIDQGIVRQMGVSNFDEKQLAEAIESTSRHSIAANQIPYSIFNRSCEKTILPFCEKNRVKVIAYTPINKGRLNGNRELDRISSEKGKSKISVGLNYLMRRSLPIPKSTNKEHILEFADALNFELSDEEYIQLGK